MALGEFDGSSETVLSVIPAAWHRLAGRGRLPFEHGQLGDSQSSSE
ncbi:MAG: hypothetical protein O3C69_00945 [Chloroflexi bacterium]|nr:hypothetical protein [Chloroflexota bacterium]